jgi:hypothetical protein
MKKVLTAFILLASLVSSYGVSSMAQCQPGLALSSSASGYGYFVRMAVHFGEVLSNPYDIVCSRSLIPGENAVNVPIWAYNLHEGADYFEFSVASNESLGVFIPDNCFGVVSSSRSYAAGVWKLNLIVQACGAVCGPVRIGYAEVVRVAGNDPVWIDLGPNAGTGRMVARDVSGGYHLAFSPMHGGYLGQSYLYACQEPICEEPNTTATAFDIRLLEGCRVKVLWTAGGGNRTMVRWSTHRFPTGIEDGHFAVEVPTKPGLNYLVYLDRFPTPAVLYFTAFSLTRDASGLIARDSFVECSAVDKIDINCVIATEETSWGAIKNIYR